MQTHNPFQSQYLENRELVGENTEQLQWLNFEFEEFSEQQLWEHIQSNPLGRLLHLIASLPEVRRDKVLRARRQIRENSPELENRLDVALDRVLEELIAEE